MKVKQIKSKEITYTFSQLAQVDKKKKKHKIQQVGKVYWKKNICMLYLIFQYFKFNIIKILPFKVKLQPKLSIYYYFEFCLDALL